MPAEEEVLHIAALQEGAVYCVTAQTVLNSGFRSNSTDTQCVSIIGTGVNTHTHTLTFLKYFNFEHVSKLL